MKPRSDGGEASRDRGALPTPRPHRCLRRIYFMEFLSTDCSLRADELGNKSEPKINTIIFNRNQHFAKFQTAAVSECCLMKLLPCISFEKCVYILALEIASPGNQHCVNCIGTPSFPIKYPEEYPVVVVEMSPECGRPFSV